MPTADEEQRLEQTKMSFGEHLEELRRALFKSLIALVLGFLVGLCVGIPLVDYIQEPLREGLRKYYLGKAKAEQLAWLRAQHPGDLSPEELKELEQAANDIATRGLIPHQWYVDIDELAAALKSRYPELAAELAKRRQPPGDGVNGLAKADAPAPTDNLTPLRLYQPVETDARFGTIALSQYEPFMVYIKASFAAGLVLASPFIFYFLWEFVAAGLYHSEKKYVHIYLPLSLGLFLTGSGLAYYFAFQYVLEFLFWFHEKMGIEPYPRLSDWITTVVLLPLAFGVSFQLPLVMLLLERIGIFSVEAYISKWRISIVVIAFLSMVLTPGGDVQSMMLMFIPLVGLYFLGILMCKYMPGGSLASPLRNLRRRQTPHEAPAGPSPIEPRHNGEPTQDVGARPGREPAVEGEPKPEDSAGS